MRKTAIKSIREYCVEVCCAGDQEYVRECPDGVVLQGKPPCPLWPYRMGKNPNVSEEKKAKARERLLANPISQKNASNTDKDHE